MRVRVRVRVYVARVRKKSASYASCTNSRVCTSEGTEQRVMHLAGRVPTVLMHGARPGASACGYACNHTCVPVQFRLRDYV